MRFLPIAVILTLFISLFPGSPASAAEQPALQLQAKSAFLMDAATGQVLYQNNPDEPLPPASMAKMMTEYLVEKYIQEGKIKWTDEVTTKENAAKQIGSRVFLALGEKHTVEQLYKAVAIASANDATVALAEYIAGSEQEFVKIMNETAEKLGMKNTHFINVTGLDRADMPEAYRPAEGETLMSARDSAILAYHIINEIPNFLEISKIPSLKFRERDKDSTPNWNWMLESNKDVPNFRKFAYPGVDGLKTGHTTNAGNCFTGTAVRNGMRLIAVVMNVPGGLNDGQRFLETAKLFDYGFNNFETKTVVEAKSPLKDQETLKVSKGKHSSVTVAPAQDLTILAPKGSNVEITNLTVSPIQEPLTAPIRAGDKIGLATVQYVNPATGEALTATLDMVASEDVDKAGWLALLFRAIGHFFSSLFKGIVDLF
jgi:D-alanyl-D-alanine carboxypeptidase (penicillin-binding protein 5/6)